MKKVVNIALSAMMCLILVGIIASCNHGDDITVSVSIDYERQWYDYITQEMDSNDNIITYEDIRYGESDPLDPVYYVYVEEDFSGSYDRIHYGEYCHVADIDSVVAVLTDKTCYMLFIKNLNKEQIRELNRKYENIKCN